MLWIKACAVDRGVAPPGLGVWGNIPGTEVLMSLIGIPVHDFHRMLGYHWICRREVRSEAKVIHTVRLEALSNSQKLRYSIQD
jgi:hypothetical protein